jgi:hypothetical protein
MEGGPLTSQTLTIMPALGYNHIQSYMGIGWPTCTSCMLIISPKLLNICFRSNNNGGWPTFSAYISWSHIPQHGCAWPTIVEIIDMNTSESMALTYRLIGCTHVPPHGCAWAAIFGIKDMSTCKAMALTYRLIGSTHVPTHSCALPAIVGNINMNTSEAMALTYR